MNEVQTLREALERKDKIIAELREENAILMKMSLKSAQKQAQIQEQLKKSKTSPQ